MNLWTVCFLFCILLQSKVTNGATVLFFLLGTNAYERHVFEFLAQQLALRHHNTITVKPILIPEEPRLVKPRLHLVREKVLKNLLPRSIYEPLENVGSDVPWRRTYELDANDEPYWRAHNHSCEKMLNSNLMSTLKKDQIEVAIVYSGNPCQLALIHALGIPFIYFDLDGFTDETIVASGTPWNLEAPSSRFANPPSGSSVLFKLFNGVQLLRETVCQFKSTSLTSAICPRSRLLDEPISRMFAEDYEIRKTFKQFPHVNWIKQNAELYFINTDPLLEPYGLSLPSHVIPVGGAHIDFPRPLFSPFNTSVGPSQLGMILVQLGSNVDGSSMSQSMVRAFVGALSRLKKYRIYWRIGTKLELKGVDLDSLPSHINITTYIPQNDLLANKKTKLLITNGGMSSMIESLSYGVPILGVPLYGVNYQNLLKVQQKGLGVALDKTTITETSLYTAIRHVLETPKFERQAQEFAKEFNERSSTTFERALNAIEHVARHRSAKFLRASQRPKGFQLFLKVTNLDLFAALIVLLTIGLTVGYVVSIVFLRCLVPTSRKSTSEKEKRKPVDQSSKKHR
ncbi:Glucuronosyltransferase [Aphelenchoides besseyi]|nr:Glucuronosyltransferase [Aphelenchoides besseyi]